MRRRWGTATPGWRPRGRSRERVAAAPAGSGAVAGWRPAVAARPAAPPQWPHPQQRPGQWPSPPPPQQPWPPAPMAFHQPAPGWGRPYVAPRRRSSGIGVFLTVLSIGGFLPFTTVSLIGAFAGLVQQLEDIPPVQSPSPSTVRPYDPETILITPDPEPEPEPTPEPEPEPEPEPPVAVGCLPWSGGRRRPRRIPTIPTGRRCSAVRSTRPGSRR